MAIIEDKIFKIRARCVECNTWVDGRYKIGKYYYCADDYSKEEPSEVLGNKANERRREKFKKLFR